MAASVAQGRGPSRPSSGADQVLEAIPAAAIGAALVIVAALAYWLPGSVRYYDHFVWQAMAFLDGRAAITWPVPGNDFFQDVDPLRDAAGNLTGYGLLPFPPLPAIVLLPFVAIWGVMTDERAVSVIVGAIDVGLCWWMLGRLPVGRAVRLSVVVFFGFGTATWYAAQLGTTWFFAHVVALVPALLAVGIALRADPALDDDAERAIDDDRDDTAPAAAVGEAIGEMVAALRAPWSLVDRRQFVAGLLFGLACTARLTIIFGAPFFMLVGGGGSLARRSVSAGLGAAIPVGLLLAYNVATTGHLFHPGYEYLYQLEANGYQALGYHASWSIEDIRYLPQNLEIMFLSLPAFLPTHALDAFGAAGAPLCTGQDAARGLFDPTCPIALPRAIGMSLVVTSPAYLYVIPAMTRIGRSRIVAGAALGVGAIAFVNLLHFSQGWVQFGYRFSLDFVAFALPLVALGMARRGGVGLLAAWLVGAAVAINFWGVTWGNLLGW